MEKIDISILEKIPELTEKVTLQIEPLAPLSMVSDLPGSFYKSLKSPSKKMLCGLFENLLGWHFSINDRTAIQKELIKVRKKQKAEYNKPQQGSTYVPLLIEFFDIELTTIPEHFMYNDLWSRSFRRMDSVKHASGSTFMNAEFIEQWRNIKKSVEKDNKRKGARKNTFLDNLFKRYSDNFPMYYTTPTTREYVQFFDSVEIVLKMDIQLCDIVKRASQHNNLSYLGNSEGWINLKIYNNE